MAKKNRQFLDSAILNDSTFKDYLYRMQKIATSIFEWVNLPKSMDARYLELMLFYKGQVALLYDDKYGYINTKCSSGGYVNIYGLPTELNCYSYEYTSTRRLYTGLKNNGNTIDNTQAILVMNNFERIPTFSTLELFAYRLYLAQRSCDTNISSTRYPTLILGTEKQKLTLENLSSQYDGNAPFIMGDSDILSADSIKAINTGAPFVADKITQYKKEIWNEFLQFIGVNSIDINKKERLVVGEVDANNEVTNLNLESYLIPRKKACEQFNDLFGLTGTDKEISVRVRSDLFNIIKQNESIVTDYNHDGLDDKTEVKEGVENE